MKPAIAVFPGSFAAVLLAQVPVAPPGPGAFGACGGSGGRGGGRGNFNADPQTIPLWPNATPGTLGDTPADKSELTFYWPGRGTRTEVVIAPRGVCAGLSMENEGRQKAYWFNPLGVNAFILKYRLAPYQSSGRPETTRSGRSDRSAVVVSGAGAESGGYGGGKQH